MTTTERELTRAVLAARHEVFRLQLAALMPNLSIGQIKHLKRQERAARERRRELCRLIYEDIMRRPPAERPIWWLHRHPHLPGRFPTGTFFAHGAQLQLPFPQPHMKDGEGIIP